MADGCINTHMAQLLGAPPLLDFNFPNLRETIKICFVLKHVLIKAEVDDIVDKY